MRRALYFKDEDYRFSFLHGNYITMTNIEEIDEPVTAGTYYIKVKQVDGDGYFKLYVDFIPPAPGGPDAPTLLEPDDGSIVRDYSGPTDKPYLWWSVPNGATYYRVQVYDSNSQTVIDQTQTEREIPGTHALSDGYYYWRVKASNSAGVWGSWSDIWTFIIDVTDPNYIDDVDSNIGHGWQTNNDPCFWWSDPGDSGGSGVEGYYYELDTTHPDYWTTDTIICYYDLADGAYTFNVRAKDWAGNKGSTASYYFRIDTRGPDAPSLISPSNGLVINENTQKPFTSGNETD